MEEADKGSHGSMAVKWLCARVCVCVCVYLLTYYYNYTHLMASCPGQPG